MSLWKDKKTKTWKYTFQVGGQTHGGGGHKSKKEAITAREEKRARVLAQIGAHSQRSLELQNFRRL